MSHTSLADGISVFEHLHKVFRYPSPVFTQYCQKINNKSEFKFKKNSVVTTASFFIRQKNWWAGAANVLIGPCREIDSKTELKGMEF